MGPLMARTRILQDEEHILSGILVTSGLNPFFMEVTKSQTKHGHRDDVTNVPLCNKLRPISHTPFVYSLFRDSVVKFLFLH